MSALHTPTLPRRDTLRAHPQPEAALPKEEYTLIAQIPWQAALPSHIGARLTHTDGFKTDGTHRRHNTQQPDQ